MGSTLRMVYGPPPKQVLRRKKYSRRGTEQRAE